MGSKPVRSAAPADAPADLGKRSLPAPLVPAPARKRARSGQLTRSYLHASPCSKLQVRPWYLGFVDLLSGLGAGALGLIHAGLLPLLIVEACKQCCRILRTAMPHVKVVQAIIPSQTLTTELERIAQLCGGRIPMFIVGLPCQGNSLLNVKYLHNPNKQDNSATGDPRLWLGIQIVSMMLSFKPWYIIIEQVANYVHTLVFKKIVWMARKHYKVSYWEVTPTQYGSPQRRRRVYILMQRKGPKPGDPSGNARQDARAYVQAMINMRASERCVLGNWWPSVKLFATPVSPDLMTHTAQIRGPEQDFPTITTRTATYKMPRYGQYDQRSRDVKVNREEYQLMKRMNDLDLRRLQGLPRGYPLPRKSLICEEVNGICDRHKRQKLPKYSTMLGNAMHVPTVEAIGTAVLQSITRKKNPGQLAKIWKPSAISVVPTGDLGRDHQQRRFPGLFE